MKKLQAFLLGVLLSVSAGLFAGLETVTYIDDFNTAWPLSSDPKSEGDNHLRNIKAGVVASFPNITGAMTSTQAELNILDGATVTTAEVNLLGGKTGTIWTSTNDGAGSTLDADLLDAQSSAYYLARVNHTGTIDAADIATGAVTTTGILDGTIASVDIATGGVASVDILDGTIASADIATNAVTGVEVNDNSLTSADIAANAIGQSELASGTVGSDHFDKTLTTTGSISVSAGTCTTVSSGVWMTAPSVGASGSQCYLQVNSGGWKGDQQRWAGGLVVSDGTNVRFCESTSASTCTVYYRKLD